MAKSAREIILICTVYCLCKTHSNFLSLFLSFFFFSTGSPLAYAISPVVLVSEQTYRMTCSAYYDYPTPVYTWSRADGVPLTPSRFSTTSSGQLVVDPVSTLDQTLFVCRAENQYGSSSFTQAITIHGQT